MSIFLANPLLENEEGMMTTILMETSILENKYPFKALHIFGPAGAGKTTFIKYLFSNIQNLALLEPGNKGVGFNVINPDIHIEREFPKFNTSLKFVNREENPEMFNRQQDMRTLLQTVEATRTAKMLNRAYPVLQDSVGSTFSEETQKFNFLKSLGYDNALIIISVPENLSMKANQKRKRTIPSAVAKEIYDELQANINKYFAKSDSFELLGNSAYVNLYDLTPGKEKEIRPDLLKHELMSEEEFLEFQKTKYSAEHMQQLRQQIIDDFQQWIKNLKNPVGLATLKAMRELRTNSANKARLGERITDLFYVASMSDEERAKEGIKSWQFLENAVKQLPNGLQAIKWGKERKYTSGVPAQPGQLTLRGYTGEKPIKKPAVALDKQGNPILDKDGHPIKKIVKPEKASKFKRKEIKEEILKKLRDLYKEQLTNS